MSSLTDNILAATDYGLSPIDSNSFSSNDICSIQHDYADHPLLQIQRLESLAGKLYETEQCRFVNPGMDLKSDFWHESKPTNGQDLSEFFERISEPESWIALYNVETDPEYKALVESIVQSRKDLIEPEQGSILEAQGFIFISAPPSVTPFHIDRENNFWLQIRGTKEMTVFDHTDTEVVSATAIEDFISNGTLKEVALTDSAADKGRRFITKAGDGVYFPSTSPHMTRTTTDWVTDTDNISISIGVVFYTEKTRMTAQIYQCNRLLRKFGLKPTPPGSNSLLDSVKASIGHYWSLFNIKFRNYNPPPHSY